jgi:5-methylcytosine-specific restriction protein A
MPLHQCRYQGCRNKTNKSYCPEHADVVKKKWQKDTDRRRGTSTERGYDGRWAKYRIGYLKEHPLCVECEKNGKYVPAKDIDHIIPVNGQDDPLFWEPTNHQGLCHRHHGEKTARENGAFGNKRKE